MKRLRDWSIRTKLNLLGTATAGIALVLACVLLVANEASADKARLVKHLTTIADMLGNNSIAALTFDDPKAAKDVLASLKFEPTILAAAVYNNEGQIFASYGSKSGVVHLPRKLDSNELAGALQTEGLFRILANIHDNDEKIGTVVLEAGMAAIDAQFRHQVLTAMGVLLISIVLSFLFSSFLQKFVSVPVMQLAKTAEYISQNRDFSIRVEKVANDEIGTLYTAFNRMLAQIEAGEADLKRTNDELEMRVQNRTAELSEANHSLSHEVAERKRTEQELRDLQSQHLDAARRAGMAEIATSVLHNVGNVLNSVNISASVIRDKLKKSGSADLRAAVDLLTQHLDNPGEFLTTDARGKHLPRFLFQLSHKFATDEKQVLDEVKSLSESIDHIKGIVSVQQSYAGGAGFLEELPLDGLADDAIRINAESLARHGIEIVREFEELPLILTDKQKVLQILVNLVSNAKYAILAGDPPAGKLRVRISRPTSDKVSIEVIDNGVGIHADSLTRIFSLGFTTRKDGHGFGLHSAANLAREMGGALTAASDGLGTGATFTLDLPYRTGQRGPLSADS